MKNALLRRIFALVTAAVLFCSVLCACDMEQLEAFNEILNSMNSSDSDIDIEDFYNMLDEEMSISDFFEISPTDSDELSPSDTENLPESGVTLDSLKATLNEIRKNDVRTTISDSEIFLPDYESEEFEIIEFGEPELELLTPDFPERKDVLNYEEAENDVDYLFRILKTSYAPYEYFGGDEVFDKAKADILADLAEFNNKMTSYDMQNAIIKHLGFMKDSHFALNSYSGIEFAEEVYYYDSTLREFRHDDAGYFTVVGGVKYYVSAEDEQYLRLTVGDTGELVYAFITLCEEGNLSALPCEVILTSEDGSKTPTLELDWITDSYSYAKYLTWDKPQGDIPVTGIGAMMVDDKYYIAEMNAFVNRAKELRDEEVFILDLRGNMGGLSTISYMWMYNLTNGVEVEGEYTMVYYMSMLNDLVTMGNDEQIVEALLQFDFFEENPDIKEELLSEEEEDVLGEGYVYDTVDIWTEYDGTIFVLCDKAVSSAGEMFILQLIDLENVVVFGTNSNIGLISGGTNYYVPVYLPNSGISVYYSTVLVLTDDSEDFDARGIQPDVVICGEDEAAAVERCWNYYNQ